MTYNEATAARAAALDTLIELTGNVGSTSGDLLDMLGRIRLVELAADQARRAIVAEARADGSTWQEIGDALGTSRQAAQERFTR